ncbi:MAG: phosphoribosylglycinamide formyltransferase [Bryobacterales bacterium]|nr:phosphoribosylglycinamide formyltransferase [Bryobacterales bacterium]
MKRLGILLSGRGSNFEAIARNCASGKLAARIAIVIANREDAGGIDLAKQMGLATCVLPSKGVAREEHDRRVAEALTAADVDLVVLAGYMRILTAWFIQQFPQRILNIHPALLPAFPGLDAQHQAWEYGVRFSGCTVHFVDEMMDSGPVIAQAVVPAFDDDTTETLSKRILAGEHQIYSEAIDLVLSGRFRVEGRRVVRLSAFHEGDGNGL